MIEATLGKPSEPGIYAARQWHGWRILEWHDGEWWHIGRQCAWPKKAEIDAFVGPLPVIARDFSVPEPTVEDRIRIAIEHEAWRTEPVDPKNPLLCDPHMTWKEVDEPEEWERELTKNSTEYDL